MKVDPPKTCVPLKERLAVIGKYLRNGIAVSLLARKIEPGYYTGVLIKTGTFWQSAQCPFNRAHPRIKFLVGQPFFINAGECKEASVSAALERKDARPDKARDRHDTAGGSSFGEPRCRFKLLSVCAGHSTTSG